MGETLGISVNVFEKVAREKDRKERLKRYSQLKGNIKLDSISQIPEYFEVVHFKGKFIPE